MAFKPAGPLQGEDVSVDASAPLSPDLGSSESAKPNPHKKSRSAYMALTLGSLGVVFGDIGTSPLYAVRECFGERGVDPTTENVLGVLSIVL